MSDSRPTTYAELAKRPSRYREVELVPTSASPLNSIAMAERMYRRYAVSSPVSGNRTAIMHLREFQRTAQMMMDAADAYREEGQCEDCWVSRDREHHLCERHA